MPRIALVCPYSWSVPGGVQTHVAGLARALRAQGAEVDVLAPADGVVDLPGFEPLGTTFAIPDNGSVTRVALGPRSVARTASVLRSRAYDVVHVHEPMLPAVSLTAVAAARAPVVATFHMVAPTHRWYRLFTPVVRGAAARIAARIAVSDAARRFVESVLPGRYHVIPNGIDAASYATAGAGRDGTRVLFIGRPDPRKGLPVLLRAFGQLPQDASLDLVGVPETALRRLLPRELPAAARGRIRAHGRVPDEERRRLMGCADVLCAPSLGSESFGLVLAEGMAAGLPVVASNLPGYASVLPPSCGTLVRPGDEDALAAALAALLADPDARRRMGAAGREEARRYDWSALAGRVLAVYAEAVGGASAPAGQTASGGRRLRGISRSSRTKPSAASVSK